VVKGAGCCGALTHHMGMSDRSHAFAATNIRAWTREMDANGLDAIVINASGCGTTVKDYGHMFRNDPVLAHGATRVAAAAKDISEVIAQLIAGVGVMSADRSIPLRVAYQSACSLQHGQKITTGPRDLLKAVGYEVVEPSESHLCCGSAGTYNILQPDIAAKLRDRKTATLERTEPNVIASGNVGCITQLRTGTKVPVVHTVELLDWATGGPKPARLPDEFKL